MTDARGIPQNERMARVEERLEQMDEKFDQLENMRIEFIALKARWGFVAAVIGALFAGLVSFVVHLLEGVIR